MSVSHCVAFTAKVAQCCTLLICITVFLNQVSVLVPDRFMSIMLKFPIRFMYNSQVSVLCNDLCPVGVLPWTRQSDGK